MDADNVASEDKQMPEEKGISVNRDPNFVRLIADDIYIARKGLELDLSLIAFGPDPIFRISSNQADDNLFHPGPIRMRPSLSEIGRVRMDEDTAANLAMNLLVELVSTGRVDVDALNENFEKIISKAPQKEVEGEDQS